MKEPSVSHPLRSPRDYAAAILAEPSRERRNELLEACPSDWRALVRTHVEDGYAKIKAYRELMDRRTRSIRRGPIPAPRVTDTTYRISDFTKSPPEVGNAHLSAIRDAQTSEPSHA